MGGTITGLRAQTTRLMEAEGTAYAAGYEQAKIDAMKCCANRLQNASNPLQDSAAWDARNAIEQLQPSGETRAPVAQPLKSGDAIALEHLRILQGKISEGTIQDGDFAAVWPITRKNGDTQRRVMQAYNGDLEEAEKLFSEILPDWHVSISEQSTSNKYRWMVLAVKATGPSSHRSLAVAHTIKHRAVLGALFRAMANDIVEVAAENKHMSATTSKGETLLEDMRRALAGARCDQIDLLGVCRKHQAETSDFRQKELRMLRADAVEARLKHTKEVLAHEG